MLISLLVMSSILQSPAELLAQHMLDSMNHSVESHAVQYQGEVIRFNHQFWRIDPKSVCFDRQQNANAYSGCTRKAKALFGELCQRVDDDRHRNMFCNAAARYQPTIAEVHDYDHGRRAELKRQCGDLRLQAMSDKALVAKRDKVCGEYERQ